MRRADEHYCGTVPNRLWYETRKAMHDDGIPYYVILASSGQHAVDVYALPAFKDRITAIITRTVLDL